MDSMVVKHQIGIQTPYDNEGQKKVAEYIIERIKQNKDVFVDNTYFTIPAFLRSDVLLIHSFSLEDLGSSSVFSINVHLKPQKAEILSYSKTEYDIDKLNKFVNDLIKDEMKDMFAQWNDAVEKNKEIYEEKVSLLVNNGIAFL